MLLTQREASILNAVIRSYIITGEPVGSKALRDAQSMNLSPATIRAAMNRLCELGLLEQPHTSAGRIPTAAGYRYFIENLLPNCRLPQAIKDQIDSIFPHCSQQPDSLVEDSCEALAELTGCAALLTTPADREAYIKSVRLMQVSRHTAILVLLTSSGMMKSRIFRFELPVSSALLEKIDAVLRQEVYNLPLDELNPVMMQGLLLTLGEDSLAAAPAISALMDAANDIAESQVKLKGETNLLTHREFSAERAKMLFDYLQNDLALLHILRRTGDGLSIILGNETGEDALNSSGMIVTHYSIGDRDVGAIGILGPDRMDYEHIIPSVLYFKDKLGGLLTERFSDDF